MNKISQIMEGRKTWTGLIILILGLIGFGDIIAEDQIAAIINNLCELVGTIMAIYGNIISHSKIKELGSKLGNKI